MICFLFNFFFQNIRHPVWQIRKITITNRLNGVKTSALDRQLSIAKASLNIGRRWATNSAFGYLNQKKKKRYKNKHLCVSKTIQLVGWAG